VDAHVRDFADPLDGLLWQMDELRGFARVVPPLIEQDRQALWDRLGSEPSDGEQELIDVYSQESGRDTGYGFARYDRVVFSAALVLGWEVFRDYLVINLAYRIRNPGGWHRSSLRDTLEKDLSWLSPERLVDRIGKGGVQLENLPGFDDVRQIQHTRNAIVHNQGLYTVDYVQGTTPRWPTDEDGWNPTGNMTPDERNKYLLDRKQIPLDADYIRTSLDTLENFAKLVQAA
jgi:hypothetical protein